MNYKRNLIGIMVVLLALLTLGFFLVKDKASNEKKLKGNATIYTVDTNKEDIEFLSAQFSSSHPEAKVEVKSISLEELNNKWKEAAPSIDILTVKNSKIIELETKHLNDFENMTALGLYNKDHYFNTTEAMSSQKDRMLYLPYTVEPLALLYREDYFLESGVKLENVVTWEDFNTACASLKQKHKEACPLCIIGGSFERSYSTLLLQLGEYYFDKEGSPQLDSSRGVKAMKNLKSLSMDSCLKSYSSYSQLEKDLMNGKVASATVTPSELFKLQKSGALSKGIWKIRRLPAYEPGGKTSSAAEGSSFMLLKKEKPNEVALEFLKYISKDNVLLKLFQNKGIFSAKKGIYSFDTFGKKVEGIVSERPWQLFYGEANDMQAMYYSPHSIELEADINAVEDRVLQKDSNIYLILDELQRKYRDKVEAK